MTWKNIVALAVIGLAPLAARAQQQAAPGGRGATPPPADSGRAVEVRGVASWTSDRRALRVGDLLTVVVDEQTIASERVSTVARADRSQVGTLDAEMAPEQFSRVGIGYNAKSDNTGQADRRGNLVSVLSVRVTAIEPGGIARVQGSKQVTVDGRRQDVAVAGLIRVQDVEAGNMVRSSRIADAVISYKGKSIGPRTGILGKILAILWP